MGAISCIGEYVDVYSVSPVEIGDYATVSQYSFLCTASHDYNKRDMPLISAPIRIQAYAWITADVFVGPGVTVGEGAVVGARSVVLDDVEPWTVVAGNPLRTVGKRDKSVIAQNP
jgi:putative colanic acid biosynthesis acetyltransferase WcaF